MPECPQGRNWSIEQRHAQEMRRGAAGARRGGADALAGGSNWAELLIVKHFAKVGLRSEEKTMRFLVLGMSHVSALSSALKERPDPNFQVINVAALMKELHASNAESSAQIAFIESLQPTDVLCFYLLGNQHNVAALINDPQPFWMAPSAPNGHLVPQDMMVDHFNVILKQLAINANALRAPRFLTIFAGR